jgi:L-ribulose-5-phosphate 3-epimerase
LENVPLGEGMVDFNAFLKMYSSLGISGPVSIHLEYNLGGAEEGKTNPTMGLDKISEYMKNDNNWYRAKLKEMGIS